MTTRQNHERSVRRTALSLATANLMLLGGLWWIARPLNNHPPTALRFLLFAAAFAIVGAVPMRLDFSEHQVTFTLTDAVLVTGLFYLAAPWLGLAATLGELSICAIRRTPALKTVFNSASRAGAATAAATAFAALGATHTIGPKAWLAGLAAAACWSFLNIATVAAVLARAESRSYERILALAIPTALATTLLGAPLGLVVVVLLHTGSLYPVLIIPIALGLALNNRYAAAQRDEHLRIDRLYAATARTSQFAPGFEVLGVVAEEARRLLTGNAALCCAREPSGDWVGFIAQTDGTTAAAEGEMALVLSQVSWGLGAKSMNVPPELRHLGPDMDTLVIAQSPTGSPLELVVAVFRRGAAGGADSGLRDTLSAFAAHGAVIAANARLLGEVQRSLASQVEANRRKDEFVATISHELRTPLTVMLGVAQTLIRQDARLEAPDRLRFLQSAIDQGGRLKRLIDDLLLVAAADQGQAVCELSTIHADRLVDQFLSDLPSGLRKRVDVQTSAGDATFRSDQHRLRQIIVNLAENAGKYAPGSPIEIKLAADDTTVSFAVIDHGPGIPAHDRERVFERFVQLDQSSTRRAGGTGLGLFLCRQLALQLGGTLSIEATDPSGCTFILALPRSHDLDRPSIPGPSGPHGAAGLRRRPPLTLAPAGTH